MAPIDHDAGTHLAGLIRYLDASPSPFHAVANAVARLAEAGFTPLDEREAWGDTSGRHYVVRGGALVAWAAQGAHRPHEPFRILGAHTDSPNLRIKPQPDTGRAGWRQLGVEVYGGALLNSWLDRDLGLSGRVAIATAAGSELRLVHVDRPLLRVPQLAIHLDRDVNTRGLVLDPQQHLAPVLGTGATAPGAFAQLLAAELEVRVEAILGWEVMLHDLTPARCIGDQGDLLASGRIDNLVSCHAAVEALVAAAGTTRAVPVVCLFDHEEVGSQSARGADGALLPTVLERIVSGRGGTRDDLHRALAGSWCVSADGAHATHPNWAERHEPDHRIRPNAGPVLKVNSNVRYASDAESAAFVELAADRAGVPLQRFVVRTDLPCGSTIGPVTAARLGIPTVDVGVGQLSMHSARELCGAHDPVLLTRLLASALDA